MCHTYHTNKWFDYIKMNQSRVIMSCVDLIRIHDNVYLVSVVCYKIDKRIKQYNSIWFMVTVVPSAWITSNCCIGRWGSELPITKSIRGMQWFRQDPIVMILPLQDCENLWQCSGYRRMLLECDHCNKFVTRFWFTENYRWCSPIMALIRFVKE